MLKHIKSHWLHVICSSPNPCQYRRILWLALQLDSSSSKSAASSLPRRSSRGMIAARRHGLNLGGHSGRSDAPTSARHMLTQCWQQREMHTGPPALYQLHAPHGPSHGMGWSTAEAAEAPPYTSGHASAGRLPRYAHAWGAGASWSRSLCMTACATGQAGTVHAEPTAAHSTRHTMPTAVNSQQHAQPFGTASSAGAAGGGGSATARPAAPRALQQVDYTTLCALAAEVAGSWVPAKVEQVVMADSSRLCLRLRTPDVAGWLHTCWHAAAARVTLGPPPDRGHAAQGYAFGDQVSSALHGLLLTGVDVPAAWERVVAMRFAKRPGDAVQYSLYCEVMARYSNVILVDGAGMVVAAAHQVGGRQSSLRQVQVGRPYSLPPQAAGVPPQAVKDAAEWRDMVTRAADLALQQAQASKAAKQSAAGRPAASPSSPTLGDGLTRAFQGVSPSLGEQLTAAVGLTPSTAPASLSDDQWAALHGQWLAWLQRLNTGAYQAVLDPASQRYSVLGMPPAAGCSAANLHQDASVHALLHAYYDSATTSEASESLAQRLASCVGNALKKARGKVYALEKQLGDNSKAEELQRQADLITSNLYRIQPGMEQVAVDDWSSGETEPASVVLHLDPMLPAQEQAAAMYKKARKSRRGVSALQPLLASASDELSYLEEVAAAVEGLRPSKGPGAAGEAAAESEEDIMALKEIEEELISQGYLKPPTDAHHAAKQAAKAAKSKAKAKSRGGAQSSAPGTGAASAQGYRCYVSPGGHAVLVGRNNKQNDVLSHQVAQPGDVWMHVRGLPGSHTVLRLPAGASPSDADLQYAADLAAYYSKARQQGKADVIVCRASALKKPKGARPGQVLVTKEMCNWVARPEDSEAARSEAAGTAGG